MLQADGERVEAEREVALTALPVALAAGNSIDYEETLFTDVLTKRCIKQAFEHNVICPTPLLLAQ